MYHKNQKIVNRKNKLRKYFFSTPSLCFSTITDLTGPHHPFIHPPIYQTDHLGGTLEAMFVGTMRESSEASYKAAVEEAVEERSPGIDGRWYTGEHT